jgi:hypothetical protein
MMEALSSSKHRFLQEPHGLTSQKTPFFFKTIVLTRLNKSLKMEVTNTGNFGNAAEIRTVQRPETRINRNVEEERMSKSVI